MGTYVHFAGSLHVYLDDISKAEAFVREGFQQRIPMPKMPKGTPWPSVEIMLHHEQLLREGHAINVNKLELPDYWKDLLRVLQIHALHEAGKGNLAAAKNVASQMSTDFFKMYLKPKLKAFVPQEQLALPNSPVQDDL
jgi:thymidylate synthase